MLNRRRQAHDELRNVTDINVTPLLDLAFLLLVVFIIMSTAVHYSVSVNPPSAAPPQPTDKKPYIVIDINASGALQLNGRPLSDAELQTLLVQTLASKPDTQFFLRADPTRPYNEVIALLRTVTHAGVTKVALVTVSAERPRK